MRITTGEYKGRNLKTPKGIRPTQDKVRKALFDILGDVEGLTFLELFAGSGAVSIEALSRRANKVVLVENNRNCLPVIQKNIEALKSSSATVYAQDAHRAIENFHKSRKSFDIIFLDPPYYKGKAPRSGAQIAENSGSMVSVVEPLVKKTLQTLDAYDILTPNGLIVVEHFKKESLPDDLGVLSLFRQSKYGDTRLSFYKKKESKTYVPGSNLSGNI